jgi:hypothetical protein
VKMELHVRGAHGCTVLVSAFCGNELLRGVRCLWGDNESSRSTRADRQHAKDVRSPNARCAS